MNTEIKQPILRNAQELAKQFPKTFEVPEWAELHNLAVGDFAKICCGQERFWVVIDRITPHDYEGIINNDLVYTDDHQLKDGDLVSFQATNVYSILKK